MKKLSSSDNAEFDIHSTDPARLTTSDHEKILSRLEMKLSATKKDVPSIDAIAKKHGGVIFGGGREFVQYKFGKKEKCQAFVDEAKSSGFNPKVQPDGKTSYIELE